jgi:hypothetical protein
MMQIKWLMILFAALVTLSCHHGAGLTPYKAGFNMPSIHDLRDMPYYLPVVRPDGSGNGVQALRRFDLIFTGHNISHQSAQYDKIQNLAALTPGQYTHVFAYVGKDHKGLAYAVEMNVDKSQEFSLNDQGISVSGQFYLHCLGSDFNQQACPKNSYLYGIHSYDYLLAKRLRPALLATLKAHEAQLMETMASDLAQNYPFQIPVDFSLHSFTDKTAYLRDDGRANGADCAAYFVSLFEEIGGICLQQVRVNATRLNDYYLNDAIGKRAVIPARYNPILKRSVSLHSLLAEMGYALKDKPGAGHLCAGRQAESGIPTPDALFNSPSLQTVALVNDPRLQLVQTIAY